MVREPNRGDELLDGGAIAFLIAPVGEPDGLKRSELGPAVRDVESVRFGGQWDDPLVRSKGLVDFLTNGGAVDRRGGNDQDDRVGFADCSATGGVRPPFRGSTAGSGLSFARGTKL